MRNFNNIMNMEKANKAANGYAYVNKGGKGFIWFEDDRNPRQNEEEWR